MLVFRGFLRILAGVFSCRHWRTRIHEGKCYCPDCGRGLIFQWAVLRCLQCHRRVESRLWFGRIFPVQRCCPHCGHAEVQTDWLSTPAYFQLHKAQLVLIAQEAQREAQWQKYILEDSGSGFLGKSGLDTLFRAIRAFETGDSHLNFLDDRRSGGSRAMV